MALRPGHLVVVAVLVAAAFAVTAWWVVRAEGSGTVVPVVAREDVTRVPESGGPLVEPRVASGAQPEPAVASAAATVVVDVAGKVRRPGIVTLPPGSRVVDAIEAAGGARRGVNLTSLNLARVLADGEQVLVGVRAPGGVAAPAASAGSAAGGAGPGRLVNINTAAEPTLEELPGVGPVTAAAIVQWRTDNGPFSAVDELMEVSGIGEATLADMAPFVTL
ncbi:MAG TPA: helix-hairpin-helix domain-containing protein [Pseudonocardia sp.]|nr:helix-hairpin-helix domain-containing protein [Pseudonocardia sp.]